MASPDDHLSQIDTLWSVVQQAHGGDRDRIESAQKLLLDRYGGAVHRYALAALRNEEQADEVFQEFALRFVRGDFGRADPARGRFRSFVKTTVFHLIIDQQRRKQRDKRQGQFLTATPEPAAATEEDRDALFDQSWRDDLLARAWQKLEALEEQSGKPYHTALRTRVEYPDLRSPELAERLAETLGKPMTSGAARVLLHRAREAFAEGLLTEVRDTLRDDSPEGLEDELIALGLYEYCRPILEKQG
ncbi:RNA polymerase sigma factor [Pirellulimonas nuda]|uniref:RNA polymerase sigma factor n=1 Tax=Pirellulimonas nuda TaxID=2528009 RepID=A0A518DID0_9BACT|nr:sigma-70 family RNA polymerase sigma factor [Pirellulimonas nuda]QDU91243.1 RNA polymerase sigma factor [Pirellulimonas nuda]